MLLRKVIESAGKATDLPPLDQTMKCDADRFRAPEIEKCFRRETRPTPLLFDSTRDAVLNGWHEAAPCL